MSKKIFITIFFTIICLFFANHYWFDYKPVPIAFNIFGEGEWIIRTYLLNPDNNIDTDPFKTVSMHKSIINTNKKKKYFATIKVNKKIEYIRINFTKKTPVSKDETLVIQPVWFNRVKLGDLEKYKTENAELITEDCGLVLIPQQELFSLVYDANINFIPHKQLNFILFALILIFAIIFSYKFSGYIIEFKTKKRKKLFLF
ncbi:MAG: hypothetical protein LUG16_03340 [Candidatus Gastranaerophilales bacterium]|nr:hypothetical protein [Candidatus Gastranaerophilales bacterium]